VNPALAHLIPPQAFEVNAIADLKQEIFGPVLHIVRWRAQPTWATSTSTATRLARWWACSRLAVKA
jgi:acyl-CoA reductase-like NAD-dependent aldehyde dehydrogenase